MRSRASRPRIPLHAFIDLSGLSSGRECQVVMDVQVCGGLGTSVSRGGLLEHAVWAGMRCGFSAGATAKGHLGDERRHCRGPDHRPRQGHQASCTRPPRILPRSSRSGSSLSRHHVTLCIQHSGASLCPAPLTGPNRWGRMESAGAAHSDALRPADLCWAAAHPALRTEQ